MQGLAHATGFFLRSWAAGMLRYMLIRCLVLNVASSLKEICRER